MEKIFDRVPYDNSKVVTNGLELHSSFSSDRSKLALNTSHPDLVHIFNKVAEIYELSALEGARLDSRQLELFNMTPPRTKLNGIDKKSKHQVNEAKPLSTAIDVAPYPISFEDKNKARARFYYLAGIVQMATHQLLQEGIITHKVRWGGDWDSDGIFDDQSFDDLPHFELVGV